MAVVTVKSTQITNRDASPLVKSPANLQSGRERVTGGMAAAANGDSIGSKYILGQVPSNARMVDLLLTCSAITTCAGDVGLYDNTANGGAVVDVDFFSAAKSLAAALKNSTVLRDNVLGVTNFEKPIWQALGLTADPSKTYDIVITLTAAAASAGNVAVDGTYVVE